MGGQGGVRRRVAQAGGDVVDNFEKFAEDNEDLLQHGPIV